LPKYRHALALYPYGGDATASMGLFPPTGLEYIATSMRGLVGKVTLLDLRYEHAYQEPGRLAELVRNERVDLLCISVRWRSQFDRICELINRLPRDITTVLGGYQATLEVEELFTRCPGVDLIVRGEGEEIIQEIVNGVPYHEIRGLSYRRNGELVHNANQQLPDVARIAYPDRSLRRHAYHWVQHGVQITKHTFDTVLTTRGCPFKCKFCTFSLNPLGQKREYTERPLDSVIEELKNVSADVVLFSDDNLFTDPRRGEQLCDRIVENGLRKTYVAQARIDIARYPRLLEKAWNAGFRVFLVGIESPHDRILKQLQKGITREQIRDAFRVFANYDFFIHGYFIYGNIGETEQEMLEIASFAKELKIDSITFQKLRIEKFSPLKELVDNTEGYYYERIGGPVYSSQYGDRELKRIRNTIRKRFYDMRQIRHILRKAMRLGLLTGSDIGRVALHLPTLVSGLTRRGLQKRRKRRQHKLAKAGAPGAGATGV